VVCKITASTTREIKIDCAGMAKYQFDPDPEYHWMVAGKNPQVIRREQKASKAPPGMTDTNK
jgi:hypothetical protein